MPEMISYSVLILTMPHGQDQIVLAYGSYSDGVRSIFVTKVAERLQVGGEPTLRASASYW